MKKLYTIGEIFRLGLLKDWDGKPYKNKVTVARKVKSAKFKIVQTRYGPSKQISLKDIKKLNNKSI